MDTVTVSARVQHRFLPTHSTGAGSKSCTHKYTLCNNNNNPSIAALPICQAAAPKSVKPLPSCPPAAYPHTQAASLPPPVHPIYPCNPKRTPMPPHHIPPTGRTRAPTPNGGLCVVLVSGYLRWGARMRAWCVDMRICDVGGVCDVIVPIPGAWNG